MTTEEGANRSSVARSPALAGLSASPELLTLGYLLAVGLVVLLPRNGVPVPGPVRVALGVGLAFFLPGYAVVGALFPAEGEERGWFTLRGRSITWGERLALSFAVSLGLIPLLGIGLALAGLGFDPLTVVATLAAVVLLGTAIGGFRRLRLPSEERHVVPYGRLIAPIERTIAENGRAVAVLDVVLAVLAVGAVATLAAALVAPPTGGSYSGFYLLEEDGDGELAAADYPEELVQETGHEFHVGIDNHEGERTTYHVVAELQRVRTNGTDVVVAERQRVDRFEATLGPGETVRERRTVTPEATGEDLRLVYYLYTRTPPETPTIDGAYRSVYIWVDVRAASN